MVPAASAFCMKWKRSSSLTSSRRFQLRLGLERMSAVMPVRRRVHVRLADDDEPAVAGLQHLDGRLVESGGALGGGHPARRAGERAPPGAAPHPGGGGAGYLDRAAAPAPA